MHHIRLGVPFVEREIVHSLLADSMPTRSTAPEKTDTSWTTSDWAFLVIGAAGILAAYRLFLLPSSGALGENDRSRWVTARALVASGTYAIGRREPAGDTKGYRDAGFIAERNWSTVDRLFDQQTRTYSSSHSPLLATVAAGEYWVLRAITDIDIADSPRFVVTVALFLSNWLPFVFCLCLLYGMVREMTKTAWTQLFVLVSAGFATLQTTFVTTLNNHTVAAWTLTAALALLLSIKKGARQPWRFAALGVTAALTVCNEPLSAVLLIALAYLARSFRKPMARFFLPALLATLAAVGMLNFFAVGSILGNPPKLVTIDGGDSFVRVLYHMTIGHHGFFSITPIFLLSLIGAYAIARSPRPLRKRLGALPIITFAATVVLLLFYAVTTNNYGGMTAGLRWSIWLTPLWLLLLVPGVEEMQRTTLGRTLCILLLVASIFLAHISFVNPWQHPWLYVMRQHSLLLSW